MFLRFFTGLLLVTLSTSLLSEDQCSNWKQAAYKAYKNYETNIDPEQNKKRLQNLHKKMQKSACIAMDKHYISLHLSRLLYEEIRASESRRAADIDALKKQIEKLNVVQQEQRRYLKALSHLRQAGIAALESILAIEPTFWPILVDLGDYHDAQKAFEHANSYYNRALDAINNVKLTPEALMPDPTIIQELYAKADNSRAATQGYLHLFSRSGGYKTRGINPTSRTIPIHFDSGTSALEGADKKYAIALYKALRQQGSPNIDLIGHTDPKGNADMNLTLSKQRARTVARFLKKQGYSGQITATGKGEAQPLSSPRTQPLKHYGKARWYRMLRRVEIKTD